MKVMNILCFLVVATFCIAVDSTTTPDEMMRIVRRVGNRVRVEASIRLNLAEVKALAAATGVSHGACIVRAGAPGLFEVNAELRRVVGELNREAMTAPNTDLAELDLAEYETTLAQRIGRPINNIVDNRILAINGCT